MMPADIDLECGLLVARQEVLVIRQSPVLSSIPLLSGYKSNKIS